MNKKSKFIRKDEIALYVMSAPITLFLLIWCYAPMAGLIMAFQNLDLRKGIFASPFVGLKNFEFLFSTSDAFIITRNTVLYNLAYILINLFLAVTLALLLSSIRSSRSGKVMQTIYMMPYFLSWAAVQICVFAFLDRENGLVNQIISIVAGERRLTLGLTTLKSTGIRAACPSRTTKWSPSTSTRITCWTSST